MRSHLQLRTPKQSCNKTGTAVVNHLPKIMSQTLASEPMKTKDTSVATKIVTDYIRVTSSTLVIGDRTVSRIKFVILRGEVSRDIYGISCNSCLRDSDKVTKCHSDSGMRFRGFLNTYQAGLKHLLEQLCRDIRRSAERKSAM